jgi:hypothetical protein
VTGLGSSMVSFGDSDSRHGVILLSRSPSCPPLLVAEGKQASPDMQKTYDTLKPLLEAAGFGEADLGLLGNADDSFKPGKANPRRPYRQFWKEGVAPTGSEASEADATSPTAQFGGQLVLPERDNLHRPPSPTPNQQPHSYYLRAPKLGESVVFSLGVFGVVTPVTGDGPNVSSVTARIAQQSSGGATLPAVGEDVVVERDEIVWDPRGTSHRLIRPPRVWDPQPNIQGDDSVAKHSDSPGAGRGGRRRGRRETAAGLPPRRRLSRIGEEPPTPGRHRAPPARCTRRSPLTR